MIVATCGNGRLNNTHLQVSTRGEADHSLGSMELSGQQLSILNVFAGGVGMINQTAFDLLPEWDGLPVPELLKVLKPK